jgi:hypothetical protein
VDIGSIHGILPDFIGKGSPGGKANSKLPLVGVYKSVAVLGASFLHSALSSVERIVNVYILGHKNSEGGRFDCLLLHCWTKNLKKYNDTWLRLTRKDSVGPERRTLWRRGDLKTLKSFGRYKPVRLATRINLRAFDYRLRNSDRSKDYWIQLWFRQLQEGHRTSSFVFEV